MKKILIILIIGLILLNGCNGTGATTATNRKSSPVKSVVRETIKNCPYECCINANYKRRDCGSDYDCLNNKCIAKDTDGDGLSDIEEKQYGTSSTNADTDGDSLTDYVEIRIKGTNPLKRNSDNDRYDDNEDPNPLIKNSANINLKVIKNEENWDEELKSKLLPILGCLAIYSGELSLGEATGFIANLCAMFIGVESLSTLSTQDILHRDIEVQIQNSGNDYTSYVRYKMMVYVKYEGKPKEFFNSKGVNMGVLKSNGSYIAKTKYSFKVKDYTISMLKNILEGKIGGKVYILEFENIDYEKFE